MPDPVQFQPLTPPDPAVEAALTDMLADATREAQEVDEAPLITTTATTDPTTWEVGIDETPPATDVPVPFRQELRLLLNRHGRDVQCGMDDLRLADVVIDFLAVLSRADRLQVQQLRGPTTPPPTAPVPTPTETLNRQPILHQRPEGRGGFQLPPLTREEINEARRLLGMPPLAGP